ncbi:MAG: hypothetical protein EOO54_22235, partial [Haliea sp.]
MKRSQGSDRNGRNRSGGKGVSPGSSRDSASASGPSVGTGKPVVQDPHADNYAALHGSFRWQVDSHFNIADVCCRRWAAAAASAEQPAILTHRVDVEPVGHSFAQLQQAADALSHALAGLGVRRLLQLRKAVP